ncbi:MmyB family transcriptional regulator [Streptomyces decoyicus]
MHQERHHQHVPRRKWGQSAAGHAEPHRAFGMSRPAEHTSAVKAVDHPEAGTLVFDATLLPLPELPGHHLILRHPRPSTDTQGRLEQLMGTHSLVVSHPG